MDVVVRLEGLAMKGVEVRGSRVIKTSLVSATDKGTTPAPVDLSFHHFHSARPTCM
jgi:hypothetical protein